MITERDTQTIKLIYQLKAVKTSTVSELIYPSYRVAAKRLNILAAAGELHRERDGWCNEYVYFLRRPKQLRHALVLSDFYRELHRFAKIIKFIPEPSLGAIRPDAVVGFEIGGVKRLALIEVNLSNNDDCAKYKGFEWQKHFPIKPEIILISDRPVTVSGYKVTSLNIGMEGIECLLLQ